MYSGSVPPLPSYPVFWSAVGGLDVLQEMKFVVCILGFAAFIQFGTAQDPRAVGIHLERGIEEEGRSTYLRKESNFSIVVYGPTSSRQVYRILGVDREFGIDGLTDFLTNFYEDFQSDAKTKMTHTSKPIPVPNILYSHGVWSELTEDGPKLVTRLAKNHGVALYRVTATAGYKISSPPAEFKVAGPGMAYELQCIAYYQKRLKDAATRFDEEGEPDGADQPATAPKSKSEGKEKPKTESDGRSQ